VYSKSAGLRPLGVRFLPRSPCFQAVAEDRNPLCDPFRTLTVPSALLCRVLLPFLRLPRHRTRSWSYVYPSAALASAALRQKYRPNQATTCTCDVGCECRVRRCLPGLPPSGTCARLDRTTKATCQAVLGRQISSPHCRRTALPASRSSRHRHVVCRLALASSLFPKRRQPQINFLADSLAGLGLVTPRSSRDICEKERARLKRAHHIIRYEAYVECSCGFKGRSHNHACRKCGAKIDFRFASAFESMN